MRNKNWLRYGIASASLAGLVMGGVLVACGDDDSGTTPGTDAGTDTNTPGTDSGGGDTGTPDSSKPDAGQPAKLILVHAATDLGAGMSDDANEAIRVCFATAPKGDPNNFQVTPFPVLPHSASDGGATDNPGIQIGTGGAFPSSGADYEDLVIRPYVMNAQRLNERGITGNAASTPRCNQVLKDGFVPDGGWDGGEPLQKNLDFWQLADIPAGVLKKNHTYMLALTGCAGDAPTTSACGPGDDGNTYNPTGAPGNGNLKIVILELDTASSIAADELGAQVIHASPQYAAATNVTAPPFKPTFGGPDAGDAGLRAANDGSEVTYNRDAGAPTALVKVKGVVTSTGFLAMNPAFPTPASEPVGKIPLNNVGVPANPGSTVSIQFLTTGKADPAEFYVNGKAYTFVLVGDPNPGVTGLRGAHFLGFPNQFTPPPLQ